MTETQSNGGAAGEARAIQLMARFLDWGAAFVLFGLMGLTFVDVIAREAFNAPLDETTDATQLMLAAMVYAVLPAITRYEQHVAVDLFDRWAPKWAVRPRQFAINLTIAAMFGLMAWQIWIIATEKIEQGELTQFVEWPIAPIFYLISVMSALAALAALSTGILYLVGSPPKDSTGASLSFD